PANMFVARFIGSPSMNMFRMRASGSLLASVQDAQVTLPFGADRRLSDDGEIIVGVRAHHLRVARQGERGIPVTVDLVEHLGRSTCVARTPLSNGLVLDGRAIVFESETELAFSPGGRLTLTADPASLVLFNASDGTALEGVEMARRTIAPAASLEGNLQR